jgi:D-inositol-3-phosphate glycosyltransferase
MALSGAKAQVKTVYNGVLHNHFGVAPATRSGEALRASLGIPSEAVVFLFVGAIVPEKGLKYLVRAFSRLAERNPQVVLLVVGSASLWDMHGMGAGRDYETELMTLLLPLTHAGRAHLLNRVSSSDMPGVYAASDVTVMPSVWPEPFGLVALEALAAGRPVIASNVGGLPELIGPHNGCLVPPADDGALEASLEAFIDPTLRARTGRSARESAARFSWSGAAQALEQVYASALFERAA